MVIDLQNLITSDNDQIHDIEHGGMYVSVPTTCSINQQSKQGLKPTNEKIATITTKRYKANVQQHGMSQEIVGEGMDVTANATK